MEKVGSHLVVGRRETQTRPARPHPSFEQDQLQLHDGGVKPVIQPKHIIEILPLNGKQQGKRFFRYSSLADHDTSTGGK